MKKFYFLIIALLSLGIEASNAQYNVLLNFNDTNGANPNGSLILLGNVLYGMAGTGGKNGDGCAFSLMTNGTLYKDLFDFNITNGAYPYSSFFQSGAKLYGMTSQGGADNYGNIFSIDTNGTSYKDMLDFNDSNGAAPLYNSIILIDGTLYGTSDRGTSYNMGNIFSIDTNGSNFTDLYKFKGINDGANPAGTLTFSGGKFYGTASWRGVNHDGVIYSIDTNGNNYKVLLEFDSANGAHPLGGSMLIIGSRLFGMAQSGGGYGCGCIFSIDSNGAGYKDLHDFNDTNGAHPENNLILSGGIFYGTAGGGTYNKGCIFSIDTNGTNYKTLFNFNGINGSDPMGVLILSGNILYGMTWSGGIYNQGVVFGFNPCQNNIYNEPICIATIDTANNKAEVIWGRTNSPPQNGWGNYNIYRDSSSVYVLKHSQALDSLTEYIDTSSNPSAGPVSYELSTVDSCGESALSAPHTTIFLTVTGSQAAAILNWTAYVGFTPSVYRIFRGPALNAMAQFDSVPGTVLTFTDSFPHIGYYYAVEAVNPSGTCIPTASIKSHSLLSTALSGSFSNGFNSIVLGVPKIGTNAGNMNVSPNPNNGQFIIKSSVVRGQSSVEVYNVLGEKVYSSSHSLSTNHYSLDLSNQPNGIYLYRVLNGDGSLVGEGKVIIQK